ncbi:MAG: RNA-binding cell elongation regulator Jag/EloR [Acidimicrobiia bacterium]|nr:RNA-binding cell elongation regulator Jag/EloR [Acidimicrobiia bacterium]MDX2468664.1 RNA-binding cell elongation regulator Jag/EloR [Acidimicrobiia bacterium]
MEWVEAVGRTVDEAVSEAMEALGESSLEAVDVEVVEEPKKGFLGIGGQDARVKVTPRPKKKRRRRGGRTRERRPQDSDSTASTQKPRKGNNGGGGKGAKQQQNKSRDESKNRRNKPKQGSSGGSGAKKVAVDKKPDERADIEEQAQVAQEFAEGLLVAFGVDGEVITKVEDEILFIDINGDQTEALVGRKGAVVQAVHELTRTVIQRKTFGAPRMRLDIAGYGARRREALKIYATGLAETVKEDGREAMLEPMNAADRKVVHDAISEIDGVRSFSEGEDPNRSVVVAPS